MFIPFNRPPYSGREDVHVLQAMRSAKMSGDGPFGLQCQQWFEVTLGCSKALLTPSCTHALEMAALLLNIQPGDEVIMPSFTFVSTANAFVLRGARIVFVDVRPDTMNMDEALIEAAITSRTRVIVPVHYAGVVCEMDSIMDIASRYGLYVVEDAAQAVTSTYRGRQAGSIGHLAAFSFHETKNLTSGGEGGLLVINDQQFVARAEVIREKGTNRSQFFRGEVDKYTWVDIGSSYLPSEIQAAYLWGQIESMTDIMEARLTLWNRYADQLRSLVSAYHVALPTVPEHCTHNGHMFYLKVADLAERTELLAELKAQQIHAVFHYVPLHAANAGVQHGRFSGHDRFTTLESERLLRLPLYYGMSTAEQDFVIAAVLSFYDRRKKS